jgi:hypothetical protein
MVKKTKLMNIEAIFMKNFVSDMKNTDIESFKRDYPTLYECIIKSMRQVQKGDNLKICSCDLKPKVDGENYCEDCLKQNPLFCA